MAPNDNLNFTTLLREDRFLYYLITSVLEKKTEVEQRVAMDFYNNCFLGNTHWIKRNCKKCVFYQNPDGYILALGYHIARHQEHIDIVRYLVQELGVYQNCLLRPYYNHYTIPRNYHKALQNDPNYIDDSVFEQGLQLTFFDM